MENLGTLKNSVSNGISKKRNVRNKISFIDSKDKLAEDAGMEATNNVRKKNTIMIILILIAALLVINYCEKCKNKGHKPECCL